ncbi:MAG: heme exporter protein CcmD [Acidiferrobacter sp.]
MTWSQFWAMGGFAFYVWSAYAFTLVVVVINIVAPLIRRRQVMRFLHRYMDRAREEP